MAVRSTQSSPLHLASVCLHESGTMYILCVAVYTPTSAFCVGVLKLIKPSFSKHTQLDDFHPHTLSPLLFCIHGVRAVYHRLLLLLLCRAPDKLEGSVVIATACMLTEGLDTDALCRHSGYSLHWRQGRLQAALASWISVCTLSHTTNPSSLLTTVWHQICSCPPSPEAAFHHMDRLQPHMQL